MQKMNKKRIGGERLGLKREETFIGMSDFTGNSVKLAIESIRNAYFRQHYIDVTRQIADDISLEAQHAELMSPCQRVNIWEGAAKKASTLRNDWLHRTRRQLSPSALAFSKMLKSKAPSFADLLAKYSARPQIDHDLHDSEKNPFDLYDIKYVCSRHSDKVKVFQAIVNSSGRTNARIN
ncbi:hypothetical protein MAR_035621, partial [Mya arenaria]